MENTQESTTDFVQEFPVMDRWLQEAVDEGFLAGLDGGALMDLLEWVECRERATKAVRCGVLAAVARQSVYGRGAVQDAATEVACALRISERSAQAQVAEALVLTRLFPEAWGGLAAGRVQVTQVRALIETTSALDDAAARDVQERVLGKMGEQTPATTRRALSRAVLKVDPEGAARRHEAARKDRRVAHYPEADGMGTVSATLAAEQAVHAMAVIDAHARASKQPGDARNLEQARADSFYQLVTGCQKAYPPAVVTVTVGVDTLLGIDQEPGDLVGYGPVTARTVRRLAAQKDAVWRRLLTEPATGLVVKSDPYTYRPTADVRRLVSARDGHCHFPGCAMPASRTDLDHVVEFDHRRPERGGLTTAQNLQALCRRHHQLKTHGDWSVRLSATGVTTTWTAPSGRRYETVA